MKEKDNLSEMQALNKRLSEQKESIFKEVRDIFRGKSVEEIKKIIRISGPGDLRLLAAISLATEDYEICEAVKQTVEESLRLISFPPAMAIPQ